MLVWFDHPRSRALAVVAVALVLGAASAAIAAGTPRIVNGLTTHDFPTTGALLRGFGGTPIDPNNATIQCSGTLIGCRTFLTAAHCISGDLDASHYAVYLQHAGVLAASSVTVHPDYSGLSGHDVAIVKLASDATGIAPTPINAAHDLVAIGIGLPGTIAGFGRSSGSATVRDYGIKRFGAVQTASCDPLVTGGEGNDKLVCWDFALPVGPPGQDSDTCNGDSGGPLFLDFGGGAEVAGVTSSGSSAQCKPLDHAWDASVYFNAAWIQGQIGADSTASCGPLGPVGTSAAIVMGIDGVLTAAHPSDSLAVDVPAGTAQLRFALNGQDNHMFNVDFFVKQGTGASPTSFDCKADGASDYGFCEFANPVPGTWSIFVLDAVGAGEYQVTATAFAAPAGCGDGVIQAGESCDDGAANGTPGSCCTTTCNPKPAGADCTDDGNVCTLDVCDGSTSVCQHPAGHAGAVCRAAAGVCDLAEACDGVSATCPADAVVPDTDGDGLCDAIDPCTNVAHGQDFAAASHPKVVLSKVNTDAVAGNDGLVLSGAFSLAAGQAFAAIDPLAHGARLYLTTAAGTTIADVTLVGGAFGGKGTSGWTLNHARNLWTFKDATGAPANGIVAVRFKDDSRKMPRRAAVSITGKNGAYPVAPGDEPLHAIVVLGDQTAAAAGLCGESAFAAGDCGFNQKGSTLSCKQ